MKTIKLVVLLVFSLYTFTGCLDKNGRTTTLEIIDNDRHYYPILQGQELNIVFKVKNTGNVPFILKDIISTCGCITADDSGVETIAPGKEGQLILKYNSNKNIGFSEHYITLYGNLKDPGTADIAFDLHVVPEALYTKDYEELYQTEKSLRNDIKNNANGVDTNPTYYLNGD